MPTYEYICKKCGKQSDIVHRMAENYNGTKCPFCNEGTLKRSYTPTPALFRGAGFYSTDSR